jgi:UDP-N-acetylglucosamine--N-acetylmuramyl-(pentapeptide) pyrophosphoryl-undecaprenol N-acetylglucosamine transferase
LAARSAKAVFIAFPEAEDYFESAPFLELLGNPLRAGFHADSVRPGSRPRILITGGSLGARTLCRAAIEALPALAESFDFEAVLQTGEAELAPTREALQSLGSKVEVHSFLNDMPARMAAADLIVGRAGAMTLAEITALGKPALLIPFPYATDDHQSANARSLVEAGAALLVADDDLDGARLLKELHELLGDKEGLANMGRASLSLGRPDAAVRILARVENILAASGSR